MNSISEKEKKLSSALERLKDLNFKNPGLDNTISEFNVKKNQLEIEKKELQNKYSDLISEHQKLKDQLKIIKDKNSKHKLDQLKFNEKIDELNQETDILLDEIDKWQM